MILRIEDTDRTRLVPGSAEELETSLEWASVNFDESPVVGGDHGPYVQSERLPIYREHADRLVEEGHAYHCFCSADRLAALRKVQSKKGLPSVYDRLCMNLSKEEVAERLADPENNPHVIRMRMPDGDSVVPDEIRGQVSFANKSIDDQILLKSDGFPTYHLASVVDDHLMGISHVIRGEEWLPSAAKHVNLYKAFGWDLPKFVHLPLLVSMDHRKLSKRHGDASMKHFMNEGYLPEALVNFVAFLGWNPGNEKELFSIKELEECFSLERVHSAPAAVDITRLKWLNAQHIRALIDTEEGRARLRSDVIPLLSERHGSNHPLVSNAAFVDEVMKTLRERVTMTEDLVTYSDYFFVKPELSSSDAKELQQAVWSADGSSHSLMSLVLKNLESIPEPEFTSDAVQATLKAVMKEQGVGMKKVLAPLRFVLTGQRMGAGMNSTIATLGRVETLDRLRSALAQLS